MPTGDINL